MKYFYGFFFIYLTLYVLLRTLISVTGIGVRGAVLTSLRGMIEKFKRLRGREEIRIKFRESGYTRSFI